MNGNPLPEFKVKVVFVGDAGVGKTSLAFRFTDNSFVQHFKLAVVASFCHRALDFKDKTVVFNIFDMADQERFRSVMPIYLRDAGIALAVYDISNYEGQLFAKDHGLYFEETSAKSGEGIDKVFNDIGCAFDERNKKGSRSSS